LKQLLSHEVSSGVRRNLNVIKDDQVGTATSKLTSNTNALNGWGLGRTTPGNVKRYATPALVIIHRAHMTQPITFHDQFLNKDGEVISTLFACGHNKDLFISVIPEGPQHKGSSNPGFT
jgi:hypothetical protein